MSKHLVLHDQSSDYSNVEDYVIISGSLSKHIPVILRGVLPNFQSLTTNPKKTPSSHSSMVPCRKYVYLQYDPIIDPFQI